MNLYFKTLISLIRNIILPFWKCSSAPNSSEAFYPFVVTAESAVIKF